MRISFDIDGTLICTQERARLMREPIRKGARELIRELRCRNVNVWIYTTSLRSPLYIRIWLLLHGIVVDGVVNEERHRRAVSRCSLERMPSKYPPAFGIDLHVDDLEGVRQEADQHGFRVVIVHPDDDKWAEKILAEIETV